MGHSLPLFVAEEPDSFESEMKQKTHVASRSPDTLVRRSNTSLLPPKASFRKEMFSRANSLSLSLSFDLRMPVRQCCCRITVSHTYTRDARQRARGKGKAREEEGLSSCFFPCITPCFLKRRNLAAADVLFFFLFFALVYTLSLSPVLAFCATV